MRRIVPTRWRRVGEHGVSMILLLRNPHTFSDEEIKHAAERAWTLVFAESGSSRRRVMKSDQAVFLQAGPHRISFVNYPKPYEEKPQENVDWLANPSQQHAWAEHTACCWVNYLTTETDLEMAHCVLAKIVVQLIDENCTGVYIPSEGSLIPAEAGYDDLVNMSSYRSSELLPKT
jgi:hypothetical protein